MGGVRAGERDAVAALYDMAEHRFESDDVDVSVCRDAMHAIHECGFNPLLWYTSLSVADGIDAAVNDMVRIHGPDMESHGRPSINGVAVSAAPDGVFDGRDVLFLIGDGAIGGPPPEAGASFPIVPVVVRHPHGIAAVDL